MYGVSLVLGYWRTLRYDDHSDSALLSRANRHPGIQIDSGFLNLVEGRALMAVYSGDFHFQSRFHREHRSRWNALVATLADTLAATLAAMALVYGSFDSDDGAPWDQSFVNVCSCSPPPPALLLPVQCVDSVERPFCLISDH